MVVHLNSHFNVAVAKAETSAAKKLKKTDKIEKKAKEPQGELSGGKLVCSQCHKSYPNKKALQRHTRDQHKRKVEAAVGPGRHLKGVCVDFENGIFLISRTFSGTGHPIHCQHKTNFTLDTNPVPSSCEVDECLDAAQVARRSGHPAFECVHLQSVQFARPFEIPVSLHNDSLEEIGGGRLKWFNEKRKQMCLNHREKAKEGGCPLVVRFPIEDNEIHSRRNVFLSVFDGGVHYWSRFGRVVVTFDSKTAKWSCRCCRAKVACIHKAISKWFLYQEERVLLEDALEDSDQEFDEEQIDEDADNAEVFQSQSQESGTFYPPSGKGLTDMITYQLRNKRLPSLLPRQHMSGFPSDLKPKEEKCFSCGNSLGDPYQITGRAMIIDLMNVKTGIPKLAVFLFE